VTSIRSKDNPQIKALIKLAGSSRERRRTGTTLLEGEHLVRAYQESGGVAETILASETALADPEVRQFFESVPAKARVVLADALLARVSQLVSSAGVAAVVRTPEPGPLPHTPSKMERKKCAPIPARMTLGDQANTDSRERKTWGVPAATAVRRIDPRFPGSWMFSSSRQSETLCGTGPG